MKKLKKLLLGLMIMSIFTAAAANILFENQRASASETMPEAVREALDSKITLKFNDDGKFKIAVFSDTHSQTSYLVNAAIRKVIRNESPDLFIFTGDNLGAQDGKTEEYLRGFLSRLVKDIEAADIPWMAVYGNHDAEDGNVVTVFPKELQQPIYESFDYNISKSGPEDVYGVGNYVVPVMSSDGSTPVINLWALDSGSKINDFREEMYDLTMLGNYLTFPSNYDYIHFSQIQWYFKTSEAFESYYGKKIPGLMFYHIPIPEYNIVRNNPEETELTGNANSNRKYNDKYWEGSPEINSGLFAAVYDRQDILGMFAGHMHVNNYIGTYAGIDFAFNPIPLLENPETSGCRIIVLNENDAENYETYCLYNSQDYMKEAPVTEPVNTDKWYVGPATVPFNGNDPIEGSNYALSDGSLNISANKSFSGSAVISQNKYTISSASPITATVNFGDQINGGKEKDVIRGFYYHFSMMLSPEKPAYIRYGSSNFLDTAKQLEVMFQINDNGTRDALLRVNGAVAGGLSGIKSTGIQTFDDVDFSIEVSGKDVNIYYTAAGGEKTLLFTAEDTADMFADGAYLSFSSSAYGAYTTDIHSIISVNGEAPNK